ncbi:hypothetical protein BsWGS_06958 [Bradybaena similaris]
MFVGKLYVVIPCVCGKTLCCNCLCLWETLYALLQLQYEVPRQEIVYRLLQVSVWDRDMLKENNFLGAVYIKLRDLDLDKENVGWHRLGRIQMPN